MTSRLVPVTVTGVYPLEETRERDNDFERFRLFGQRGTGSTHRDRY